MKKRTVRTQYRLGYRMQGQCGHTHQPIKEAQEAFDKWEYWQTLAVEAYLWFEVIRNGQTETYILREKRA